MHTHIHTFANMDAPLMRERRLIYSAKPPEAPAEDGKEKPKDNAEVIKKLQEENKALKDHLKKLGIPIDGKDSPKDGEKEKPGEKKGEQKAPVVQPAPVAHAVEGDHHDAHSEAEQEKHDDKVKDKWATRIGKFATIGAVGATVAAPFAGLLSAIPSGTGWWSWLQPGQWLSKGATATAEVFKNLPLVNQVFNPVSNFVSSSLTTIAQKTGMAASVEALNSQFLIPTFGMSLGGLAPVLTAAAALPLAVWMLGGFKYGAHQALHKLFPKSFGKPKYEGFLKSGFRVIGKTLTAPIWAPWRIFRQGLYATGLVAAKTTHEANVARKSIFSKETVIGAGIGLGASIFTGGLGLLAVPAMAAGGAAYKWWKLKGGGAADGHDAGAHGDEGHGDAHPGH